MWRQCGNLFQHHPWGGGIGSLLLLVLIVAGVAMLIRAMSGDRAARNDRDHSMEILRTKLVKGEISEEEYRRMKEILES